ncbi:MAG: TonB-dependent receptor, partial [Gammaproteobacteria bacterium]|nr:TonB-dependent receptor [Gammaproteobacteria bacterium]
MVVHRTKALAIAIAAATLLAPGIAPVALGEDTMEEVVVTGSRRAPRSVGDSMAPIDVIGGDDFENQGATDLSDMLRTLVPSYNVNTQPISDAATLVRPANLRGLPPDNTLVLVNGKRRHRGAVISFLGGGISDGAQGADISTIPAIALKQVEVLRDGASAQYGSDAIAGVINFILKDNAEGLSIEGRWGTTFDGDGDSYKIAANIGLPLGPDGFANFSFETTESDPTSRSTQRADAAQLIALGNTAIRDPAQIWGSPDISDDYKFFANIGLDLGDNSHAYMHGNYAERKVLGGFFFRNPTNRGGVFSVDSGVTRLVGDLTPGPLGQVNVGLGDGDGISCPVVNVRVDGTSDTTVAIDEAALAAIIADPNCFVFNERFPGGFTPNFGGRVIDFSLVGGVRGELDNGLQWDVSLGVGSSDVQYLIVNTINSSLGPNTPTEFRPGDYTQLEKNLNLDFSYPMDMGLYSPLNVGFGFEYREEQFEVTSVDENSYVIGPLFDQGFGIGSNGFGGFGPEVSGTFDRGNYALYLDLEADVTEQLLLGVAVRYEDFDDFGDTLNGKISARYAFTDTFAARFTASTGFRAPTPGQSNIANISTVAGDAGILVQRGT